METLRRGIDIIFDWIGLLHYKCNKITPNGCGWYKDSPSWTKSIQGTIKKIKTDK